MKKIIALALCIITVVCLVSCTISIKPAGKEVDISAIKTLGDFFAQDLETNGWSFNENYYVTIFENGDKKYRLAAQLSEDVYNKLDDIDLSDEDSDEQMKRVLSDVAVYTVEDMTQFIPTEEELKKYVGKTGRELFDEGFSSNGYMNLFGTQTFYMSKGACDFNVYFNEKVDIDSDTFETEEGVKDLTVKKIEFAGFSNLACDADIFENEH